MRCKKSDCFNCPYPDCINDYVSKEYKYPEYQKNWFREKRQSLKEKGLCPYCGKRAVTDGFKTCDICRIYFRKKRTESKHRHGVLPRCLLDGNDRCSKCGKFFPKQGQKLCERCYEQALAALSKTPTHDGKKNIGYFTQFNEVFYGKQTNKI